MALQWEVILDTVEQNSRCQERIFLYPIAVQYTINNCSGHGRSSAKGTRLFLSAAEPSVPRTVGVAFCGLSSFFLKKMSYFLH